MKKPQVNKYYLRIIPRHTSSEHLQLRNSIKEHGQFHTIKVSDLTGSIVDGYERLGILQSLKKKPNYEYKHFETKDDELRYVIENNFRRNLDDYQKAKLALLLLPLEQKLAKKREKLRTKKKVGSNEPTIRGKALDIVAKKSGLSSTTFYRAKTIIEKAPKDIEQEVDSHKTSIAHGYSNFLRATRKKPEIKLPRGKFNVILCDVPLRFDHEERGSASEHYHGYKTPEEFLEDFPIEKMPFTENAVLFIWSWPSRTRDIQKIIDEWGFKEITAAVWVKQGKNGKPEIGMGSRFRMCHENLILCEKGKMELPATNRRPPSVFIAKKGRHSEKPEIVYSKIVEMYPNSKYLELFARKTYPGFKTFSSEALDKNKK